MVCIEEWGIPNPLVFCEFIMYIPDTINMILYSVWSKWTWIHRKNIGKCPLQDCMTIHYKHLSTATCICSVLYFNLWGSTWFGPSQSLSILGLYHEKFHNENWFAMRCSDYMNMHVIMLMPMFHLEPITGLRFVYLKCSHFCSEPKASHWLMHCIMRVKSLC